MKTVKNIRERCIEFFNSEDIRKDIKEVIKPLGIMIYNEIYIYLWMICFYNVFLIFIILANLVLLLTLLKRNKYFSNIDGLTG
jgi:hypothetical protein